MLAESERQEPANSADDVASTTRRQLLGRTAALSAMGVLGGLNWRVPQASAECADQLLICTAERLSTYGTLVSALVASPHSPLTDRDAEKASERLEDLYGSDDAYLIATASLTLDNIRAEVLPGGRGDLPDLLPHLRKWWKMPAKPVLHPFGLDIDAVNRAWSEIHADATPQGNSLPRPHSGPRPADLGLRLSDRDRALQSLYQAAVQLAEEPRPELADRDIRYVVDAR